MWKSIYLIIKLYECTQEDWSFLHVHGAILRFFTKVVPPNPSKSPRPYVAKSNNQGQGERKIFF